MPGALSKSLQSTILRSAGPSLFVRLPLFCPYRGAAGRGRQHSTVPPASEEGAGLVDRRPFGGGAEGSRPLTGEA
jgi:hypothetical protein